MTTTMDHETVWSSLRWWAILLAVGMAAFIAIDSSSGKGLAPVLAASGLMYLGAAALRRPASAWPLFLGTFVVITATRFGIVTVDATWILLGLAVLFVAYGLLRGAARPGYGLPLQTIAMMGFGAAAAIAVLVGGDAGAYLVAAGLLGHAAWDVYHHTVDRVVVRSMAQFCCVLDTLLAVAIVVLTARG
jgi:hypothetical protein